MNIITSCSYLRVATISANSRSLRRLFEGGYYSKCGIYSRKYDIYSTLRGVHNTNKHFKFWTFMPECTIPPSVSIRSFCKRGHNGLFKILGGGGRHVVWACEVQIPRGAHRIQEGANAPPSPQMKPCLLLLVFSSPPPYFLSTTPISKFGPLDPSLLCFNQPKRSLLCSLLSRSQPCTRLWEIQ